MAPRPIDPRVSGLGPDDETPVFVISVAAELAGMHAQTLRQYDRLGLVIPSRTRGGGRRYSSADISRLREVQRLSQEEGVSLSAVQRIFDLENQVLALQSRLREVEADLAQAESELGRGGRFFAVGSRGDIVALRHGQRPRARAASTALVLWEPRSRS